MARICSRCGRPRDGKHHKITKAITPFMQHDGTMRSGHPRLTLRNPGRKIYTCKTRLIADERTTDLLTGESHVRRHYVPRAEQEGEGLPAFQRTKRNNARSVHESAFAAGGRYA